MWLKQIAEEKLSRWLLHIWAPANGGIFIVLRESTFIQIKSRLPRFQLSLRRLTTLRDANRQQASQFILTGLFIRESTVIQIKMRLCRLRARPATGQAERRIALRDRFNSSSLSCQGIAYSYLAAVFEFRRSRSTTTKQYYFLSRSSSHWIRDSVNLG